MACAQVPSTPIALAPPSGCCAAGCAWFGRASVLLTVSDPEFNHMNGTYLTRLDNLNTFVPITQPSWPAPVTAFGIGCTTAWGSQVSSSYPYYRTAYLDEIVAAPPGTNKDIGVAYPATLTVRSYPNGDVVRSSSASITIVSYTPP